MPAFKYAHAAGSDWRAAAQGCAGEHRAASGSLRFLYATDTCALHLSDSLSMCREATGVSHWIGTVGLGVCATGQEYLDQPAVAAMVGEFDPAEFKVFSGVV